MTTHTVIIPVAAIDSVVAVARHGRDGALSNGFSAPVGPPGKPPTHYIFSGALPARLADAVRDAQAFAGAAIDAGSLESEEALAGLFGQFDVSNKTAEQAMQRRGLVFFPPTNDMKPI